MCWLRTRAHRRPAGPRERTLRLRRVWRDTHGDRPRHRSRWKARRCLGASVATAPVDGPAGIAKACCRLMRLSTASGLARIARAASRRASGQSSAAERRNGRVAPLGGSGLHLLWAPARSTLCLIFARSPCGSPEVYSDSLVLSSLVAGAPSRVMEPPDAGRAGRGREARSTTSRATSPGSAAPKIFGRS